MWNTAPGITPTFRINNEATCATARLEVLVNGFKGLKLGLQGSNSPRQGNGIVRHAGRVLMIERKATTYARLAQLCFFLRLVSWSKRDLLFYSTHDSLVKVYKAVSKEEASGLFRVSSFNKVSIRKNGTSSTTSTLTQPHPEAYHYPFEG